MCTKVTWNTIHLISCRVSMWTDRVNEYAGSLPSTANNRRSTNGGLIFAQRRSVPLNVKGFICPFAMWWITLSNQRGQNISTPWSIQTNKTSPKGHYPEIQNICITFVQCWTNVEDVGPALYKYYANVCVCRVHCYYHTIISNTN